MQIKKAIVKVPGGMMIIPLLLGAVINTIFPSTAKTFGSFTGALMTGPLPILAVFYVCMGSTIDLKATPYILKKGGTLFVAKLACGAALAFLVLNSFLWASRGWSICRTIRFGNCCVV